MLMKVMEIYELEQAPRNFAFYVHGRGHSVAHESRELIYGWRENTYAVAMGAGRKRTEDAVRGQFGALYCPLLR